METEFYKTAYKYFEFHAKQRTASFKFYITISLGILAFMGTAEKFLHNIDPYFYLFIVFIELVISFLFCKIDKRILLFIHIAEEVIRDIEQANTNIDLFTIEHRKTKKLKQKKIFYLTYTKVNLLIYILFSVLIFSLALYKFIQL